MVSQHSLTFTEGTDEPSLPSANERAQGDLYHKRWLDQLDNRPLNFQGYLPNLAPLMRPDSETFKPSAPVDPFTKLKRRSASSRDRRSASSATDMHNNGGTLYEDLPEVTGCLFYRLFSPQLGLVLE